MRSKDVQDDGFSDFDVEGLPAMGPNGLMVDQSASAPPPPPRLCEAGPCVHYHRFAIQLDAEAPIAERIERGGKMSGTPSGQPFHVQVHHYCYPTVGVESRLGALPVLQCNRWQPRTDAELEIEERRIREFNFTARGERYQAELAAWKAERDAEVTAALLEDDVAIWILMWMRDGYFLRIIDLDTQAELATLNDGEARALTKASLAEEFSGKRIRLRLFSMDGETYHSHEEKDLEV